LGLCGKIEYEISKLSDEDRELFLNEMQISESAIDKMVRKSYEVLSLITFFTVVHDECRAWTIPNCTNIRKAAGIIHSDMERGFIRAEVINYDKFVEMGSMARCREQGLLRLEGKEYIVQDGDIVSIRFNV
jgi:ribosome-binding ATPase YchF (GTP1/OBG family)